jgi:hypothetical protein
MYIQSLYVCIAVRFYRVVIHDGVIDSSNAVSYNKYLVSEVSKPDLNWALQIMKYFKIKHKVAMCIA